MTICARNQGATRLGASYKVFAGDVSAFRLEVAKRVAGINEAAGLPGDWPVPADQRAQIRTTVTREFFVNEYGRQPEDARELAGLIARHSHFGLLRELVSGPPWVTTALSR